MEYLFNYKNNLKRIRRHVTDWEKILAMDLSIKDKGLLSKIKEFLKLDNKKMNNLTKNWAKDEIRHLTKDIQLINKHIKIFHIISHYGNTN